MATIKLDKPITSFIRKMASSRRFGNGTMADVVRSAVMYFAEKHNKCFTCPFHKDQVVGLELGRQSMALQSLREGRPPERIGGEWIVISSCTLSLARRIARQYRRTVKQLVEQAVLEHLTRPTNCNGCEYYSAMQKSVEGTKE